MEGCGAAKANLLSRAGAAAQVHDAQAKYPGRLLWFATSDITKPDAETVLTSAVKDGAGGLGEIKFHVEAAGPELRRMYALAADLNVPILIHFQEVPHTPPRASSAPASKTSRPSSRPTPRPSFIGHADAFWANISADYANQDAYPTGPVKRGGVTDKLLSDYPNLYGDLSANSGNNALSRDPEFTAAFLTRHQDKLMFGSDCSCADGNGGGVSQANNPGAARLAGKCVARETLAVLQKSASPAVFRKLAWENAHKLLRLKS